MTIPLGAASGAGRAPPANLVLWFAALFLRCALIAVPTLIAVPAAGQSAGTRPALPSGPLLDRTDAANSRCRGGSGDSPATAVACAERDELYEQARRAGWCWGHEGQAGYEMAWEPCPGRSAPAGPVPRSETVTIPKSSAGASPASPPGAGSARRPAPTGSPAAGPAAPATAGPAPAQAPQSGFMGFVAAWSDFYRRVVGEHDAAVALGAVVMVIVGRAWLFRRRFRPAPATQSRSRREATDAGRPSLDGARAEPGWENRGRTVPPPASPRVATSTALEQAEALAGPLIVDGYRRHAAAAAAAGDALAPTAKTSDARILDVYRTVGTAFREVAGRRGEHLPAGVLNAIVLGFFQVDEMGGDLLDAHLAYELNLYETQGLRETYRGADLRLF